MRRNFRTRTEKNDIGLEAFSNREKCLLEESRIPNELRRYLKAVVGGQNPIIRPEIVSVSLGEME